MTEQRLLAGLLAASLAAAVPLSAQTSGSSEPIQELDQVDVTDVAIEDNILPTSRPFNSVYGTDMSILETPRNVTIISRAQLDAISIQDVRDFSKLTSSSYTRSNFGAPANPDIRTQIADIFVNGMRKGLTSNGNGMPINFNAVESVNIVKGPASVAYGPSMYVGGYADLITKRPFFDAARGSAALTVGMYDQYRWTVDHGAPISDDLAFRLSYTGEKSGSYYVHGKKEVQALYGALTWRPSDKYTLFVNGEFFYADYTENFGINRPTQNLIDNGLYTTGINNNPAPVGGNYVDANGNVIGFANPGVPAGAAAPVSDAQNSRWIASGFPVTNRMVWGPEVPLNRRLRLLRPGDDSEGYNVTGQAVQTYKASESLTIENNTLYNFVERNTYSSYGYSEIIDPSMSLENRTEFRFSMDDHQIVTGATLRYQEVTAYNDFFFEPANVWDLTRDLSFVNVRNSVNNPNGSEPVPGWPGRFATPGVFNGDTNDSSALGFAPFIQDQWRVNDQFQILAGARVDFLRVHAKDPLKPVFIASADDVETVSLLNWNLSGVWSPNKTSSFYLTYNLSENPGGAVANGGGFGQLEDFDGDGHYTITESRLEQESELIEAGAKFSLLEDRLFLGAATFMQTRTNLNISGAIDEFETKGFEIEANYQPSRRLFLTLAYSYSDSVVNGPSFDVNNTSPFLPGQVPFFFLGPGEYERQGVPTHLVNGLVTYKLDNGFGVTVGAFLTSEINNNVAGSLVIPTQINVDTTLFYEADSFDVRLALLNTTDEKNWSAPNSVYGGESIVAELPFRAELTLRYKW